MDLVLVEAPYDGDVIGNLKYLRAAMADCFARGEAPFSAHVLYEQFGALEDSIPEARAKGVAAGLEWGAKAAKSAFYLDRGMSSDMKQGLARAKQEGRPCVFRTQIGVGFFVEITERDAWRLLEILSDKPGEPR